MSHHRLAEGISFCDLDGRIVLLDLDRDRYFGLGAAAERTFRSLVEQAGKPCEAELEPLRAARLIVPTDAPVPFLAATAPAPRDSLVERRRADAGVRLIQLPEIAARLWVARRGVGRGRLSRTLATLRSARRLPGRSGPPAEVHVPAFLATRRLLPFAPNCLRDSLALAFYLASRRAAFQLVFGVKRDPFAAHCWLQAGPLVLNDSLDSVADFRPILVI